jgi:hypothetical protein
MVARHAKKRRPVQFLGELIQWVEIARILGWPPDWQLTCSAHTNNVRKKAPNTLVVIVSVLNRRDWLSITSLLLAAKPGSCRCCSPGFALRLTHPSSLTRRQIKSVWWFYTSSSTSGHWLRVATSLGATYKAFLPMKDWLDTRLVEENWCSAGQSRLPTKTASSTEPMTCDYSAILMEVYGAFPQLYGSRHWLIHRDCQF